MLTAFGKGFPMQIVEWLKALFYGVVEGITEWLPVSSTGHLILFSERLPFRFSENCEFLSAYWEFFEVAVQLGAVLAVPVLFYKQLVPGKHTGAGEKRAIHRLWAKVLLASLPAALVGVFGDWLLEKLTGKDLNNWFYHGPVVAAMLILYGVAFLLVEMRRKPSVPGPDTVGAIAPGQAASVGMFQVLSLIPGTSRSGSTMLGARLCGISRGAAAQFSFFMAIPVMLGACLVKAIGFFSFLRASDVAVPPVGWALLAFGCLVSFFVSLCTIRFLTDFVKRHTLIPFGVYRILLGAVVLLRSFPK